MKDSVSMAPPKRSKKPLVFTLILALLCVGGMELLFCHHFSPALYRRITDPVVQPVVRTVRAAQEQLRVWEYEYRMRNVRENIVRFSAQFQAPNIVPVLQPELPQFATDPDAFPPPPPEPAVTEFIEDEAGRTILTGGSARCVYYNQGDPQWKDQPFGSDPIGPYGCGPTSMAMVVSSLTDQSMDPAQMSAWAYEHGYWCSGSGSYPAIVAGTSEAFGLKCEEAPSCDAQKLRSHLIRGGMAVALMGPGHFTTSGHFIVLHGTTLTGNVLTADPNSRENSLAQWDPELILQEAAASSGNGVRIWLISKERKL